MNPTQRWTVVGVIVLVIALLWLFWPKSDQPPAPVKGPVSTAPESKPSPAPVAAKAEEPVTASVLFGYNQSVVRPGEAPKLDELTARIKGQAFDRLDAIGHADRIGGDSYNLALSRQRAEAARAYLVGKGIDAGRIRIDARGEGEAVTGDACKNMGPESRKNQKLVDCLQRDRRVEIKLVVTR